MILFSSFCLHFLTFLQITHITYVTLLSLGKNPGNQQYEISNEETTG